MVYFRSLRKSFLTLVFTALLALLIFYRLHNAFNLRLVEEFPIPSMPHEYNRNVIFNSGFVLATHFSDQMTGSMVNVMSLQCWASTLPGKVRLVEPFIHTQTTLGFSLNTFRHHNPGYFILGNEFSTENKIKLSDLFNGDQWNGFLSSRQILPFVSWDHFIKHAPSSLIVVDQSKQWHSGKRLSAVYDSDNFLRKAKEFAEYYNFKLIRTVYYQHKVYSQEDFEKHVYGPHKPQDTVVMFNHFGGIVNYWDLYRVLIDSKKCHRNNFFYLQLRSSPLIQNLSSSYIQKYLSKGKKYISVMLRLEHMIRKSKFERKSKDKQYRILKEYLDHILLQVNSLRKQWNISEVFLTLDVSKYGTKSFNLDTGKHEVLKQGIVTFYKELFNDTVTEQDMYRRIEDVVKIRIPGLVAQIEKNIAASSTCLVLAGGGAYQDASLRLYKRFCKQKKQERCITQISYKLQFF